MEGLTGFQGGEKTYIVHTKALKAHIKTLLVPASPTWLDTYVEYLRVHSLAFCVRERERAVG